ncbi:MAG: alkaline phosphatase [Armatimonadetes bacterium]|nr:alkaline phosphatase [Candidatus Hippobium faecium]
MKKLLLTMLIVVMAVSVFAKKNVIFMIGDGMGINSVNMAEHYLGKDFAFTNWKNHLFATTYSGSCPGKYDPSKAWTDPEKAIPNLAWLATCTDSAAAATALHSGIKTANGRVNINYDGDEIFVPIGQLMKSMGYAVGSISTVGWNDATPSGPFGHTPSRGDIRVIRDMLTHPIDVLGGSNNPYYNANGVERAKLGKKPSLGQFGDPELWKDLEAGRLDYKLALGTDAIKSVAKEAHPKGPYFFALPNTGDLPYMKLGEMSKRQYPGCPEDIITLEEMALSALNVLKENDKGFFLMIEGGAIDHGNHANNWEHSVCQMTSFAEAIEGVCKWVDENSDWDETVLFITADHQTGGLINADGSYWVTGAGDFNQPNIKYTTGGHTNLPVPVFVKGSYGDKIWEKVKGTDPVLGEYIDNTDIPVFLAAFMGAQMPCNTTHYSDVKIEMPKPEDKLAKVASDEVKIDQDWAFLPDEKCVGAGEKWFEKYNLFDNAKKISTAKEWTRQGYEYESGEGWYYMHVVIPQDKKDKKYAYIYVPAADEEGWIYVNGKLAFDHSIKTTGRSSYDLWTEPFWADMKKYGAGNEFDVVIRVGNEIGGAGLYKGMKLFVSDKEL